MKRLATGLFALFFVALNGPAVPAAESIPFDGPPVDRVTHRLPVDLAVSPNKKWLLTANEGADSVSLIRLADHQLCDEIKVGSHPADLAFSPDGTHALVTAAWSGTVVVLSISDSQLKIVRTIKVGFEPHGLAIARKSGVVYVGLVATGQVAEVDWQQGSVRRVWDVGQWPRYLTLSNDDQRLAIGCSGDAKIRVFDTKSAEEVYYEPLANGINLGHMLTSDDGTYAYFTWMVYRTNPINVGNIRRGWILASRIGRVRLDGPSYREAISLDVPGQAVSDPWGITISGDQQTLVATASGTHELLVYRLPDLPFVSTGGPGDLIDRRLQQDQTRFRRIPVGGRPMGVQFAGDDRTVVTANYLRGSVQFVDVFDNQVVDEVSLGPSQPSTQHRGREVFYDGTRSLDQWYSCHSCHQNGGVNSRPMDTMNDGSEMTLKTVLPLYDIHQTHPWTWHGWQTDLEEAMDKSFTSTMQGKKPSADDRHALLEYLQIIEAPPNPFLVDGELSEAAKRGKAVFESSKSGCADCHSGPHFSDGQIHDVGLGSDQDVYDGYNTPTLKGLYRKTRWLHTGRAKTLERVVNDLHSPEKVNGNAPLTEQETADLIAYLKSL